MSPSALDILLDIFGASHHTVTHDLLLSFNRELVVKGTYSSLNEQIGHYPQWEDPDGFMVAYQEFLSKVIKEK